jgi:hypothetical protein
MKNIFVFLIFLVFIAGCAEEGVKVIKITPGQEPVNTITPSPATNQTQLPAQNATAPQNITSGNQTVQQPVSQGTPTKADLAITSYFLSGLNVDPNEAFDVKFKIKNMGYEVIKNFEYSIKIMKGSNVVKSEVFNYTQELGPGNTSDKIQASYSLPDTGAYDVVVKMDPFNIFAEPNENNNEGKQKINIIAATGNSTSQTNTNTSSQTGSCTDSDSGKNYGIKGTCRDANNPGIVDFCADTNKLWEWYCDAGACTHEEHTCFCREGICAS